MSKFMGDTGTSWGSEGLRRGLDVPTGVDGRGGVFRDEFLAESRLMRLKNELLRLSCGTGGSSSVALPFPFASEPRLNGPRDRPLDRLRNASPGSGSSGSPSFWKLLARRIAAVDKAWSERGMAGVANATEFTSSVLVGADI